MAKKLVFVVIFLSVMTPGAYSQEVDKGEIQKLLRQLEGPYQTSKEAHKALVVKGIPIVPTLIEALRNNKKGRGWWKIERVLQDLGPAVAPHLIPLLGDKSPRVNQSAYSVLARFDSKILPLLIRSLKGERDPLKIKLIDLLGRIGPKAKEAAPILKKLEESPNRKIAAAARRAHFQIVPISLEKPLTLSVKEATLQEVLRKVEKQIGVTLYCNWNHIKVSLEVKAKPWKETLEELAKKHHFKFKTLPGANRYGLYFPWWKNPPQTYGDYVVAVGQAGGGPGGLRFGMRMVMRYGIQAMAALIQKRVKTLKRKWSLACEQQEGFKLFPEEKPTGRTIINMTVSGVMTLKYDQEGSFVYCLVGMKKRDFENHCRRELVRELEKLPNLPKEHKEKALKIIEGVLRKGNI